GKDSQTITISGTKFYFHDATTPDIGTLPAATTLSTATPTPDAFESSAGTINRDMNQTRGTGQQSATLTAKSGATTHKNWFRRFFSRPLATQNLPTGVWTVQAGASQLVNASGIMYGPWGLVIKVWRPSNGTLVATILDSPTLG